MPSFRLTMKQGPTVGRSFELTKDIMTLGRDLSNDIIINDAEMSRHHTRLTRQGSNYLVEDLGSTNGTFVNSTRVTGQYTLKVGDAISLGDTVMLIFEVTGNESAATMVGNVSAMSTDANRPANVASYTPPPPPQSISAPQSVPPAKKGGNTMLYAGCGCLMLLICSVSAGIAVFLWYAPTSFWRSIGF